MALCIWLFECARCHQYTYVCTRCLGGRRYCSPCGEDASRQTSNESGRRYQTTAKGRENHKLRQRRLRAKHRQQESGSSVTHGSVRSTDDNDAMLLESPAVVADGAAEYRGEDVIDETQGPTEAGPQTQEPDIAPVLAQLQPDKQQEQPVMAMCSCCGRTGAVVVFDGRPRITRGLAPKPDPG